MKSTLLLTTTAIATLATATSNILIKNYCPESIWLVSKPMRKSLPMSKTTC